MNILQSVDKTRPTNKRERVFIKQQEKCYKYKKKTRHLIFKTIRDDCKNTIVKYKKKHSKKILHCQVGGSERPSMFRRRIVQYNIIAIIEKNE